MRDAAGCLICRFLPGTEMADFPTGVARVGQSLPHLVSDGLAHHPLQPLQCAVAQPDRLQRTQRLREIRRATAERAGGGRQARGNQRLVYNR